jgi:L-fuconolactonase
MDQTIRVDAHHHVWDLSVRDQEWTRNLPALRRSFFLDDLLPLLEQSDVRATVLVQTLNLAEETLELLVLAKERSPVSGVVGWVNLRDEAVDDELARLQALPGGEFLVGIRHLAQDEPDGEWTCRPDVLRGLKKVEQAGLVYDLLVHEHQIPSAIRAVQSRPDLRFVLDHFGKPLIGGGVMDPWESQMTELAACENVVVKFSGLVTETDHLRWRAEDLRPYVDVVLSQFGPQRMMFGSDWPVCQLAASYEQVVRVAEELTSDLSTSEKGSLFGDTAIRWYGLDLS